MCNWLEFNICFRILNIFAHTTHSVDEFNEAEVKRTLNFYIILKWK